jgi:hypothetical protein
MTTLQVTVTSIGPKLNELRIYRDGEFIGEYERSQDADVQRTKAEIADVADLLLWIFEKHRHPFVVRWDGERRAKSVRVSDIEVCIVPKCAWKTPSWES